MAAKKDEKDMTAAAAEQAEAQGRLLEQGMAQGADLGRRQTEQARSLLGAGTRIYSDMGEISQGDVESLIETSARLAKGAQDVSWEVMHYTQQSLQMSMRCANELMTCRTVEDMLKVQRNFVRQSVDSLLQESVKLLELSTGTAQEAATPLQHRVEMRQ
ncbi:MAG TPA: phasin family protein [Magnetospirillum sp.]|nr:phasin family protein [Magnetospirillum sp.]